MITVTRDIQAAVRKILEMEYQHRQVGNRTVEAAFVQALQSAAVRESISDAIDVFLEQR